MVGESTHFTATHNWRRSNMKPSILRVAGGGLLGTVVMTGIGLYVAPLMGMPAMNPADMLASQMGGVTVLGWAGHLSIGVILAVSYSAFFLERLPGPPLARGALFSLIPWLMAQLIVMPMMGMPLFSGSVAMASGSLLGHLMYGAVLGAIVGEGLAVDPAYAGQTP
jgi:uncharacterized membrane protein YagU involved in acid resistance